LLASPGTAVSSALTSVGEEKNNPVYSIYFRFVQLKSCKLKRTRTDSQK
jgi:hypothetical protein